MKLNIIKGYDEQTKNNVVLGWNLTAENEEEEQKLSLVRGMIFFGFKEDGSYPEYANIPKHKLGITRGTIKITPADPEAHSMLKDWNA